MTPAHAIAVPKMVHRSQTDERAFQAALVAHQSGNTILATALYEDILKQNSHHFDALHLLGLALVQANRAAEAEKYFVRALNINQNYAPAHANFGIALKELKKFNQSLDSYNNAIKIKKDFYSAYYNRSIINLILGNFNVGWYDYEYRLKTESIQATSFNGHADSKMHFSTHTTRQALCDKSIFVASEQGIGDCIMFTSILADLVQDTKKIICQLDRRLIGIFSRCFPDVLFVESGNVEILKSVPVDMHIRLGSLGFTYRREISDFPGTPYLTPRPERVSEWQKRIATSNQKMKVGISWRGGSEKRNGKGRSLNLEQLAPLLDLDHFTFVSLQYGEVEAEVAQFNEHRAHKLICFPKAEIDDFEDFSSLIGALDCVVSVQNTTVHTCGALGKACFTMLPFRPEWRYGATGSTMPWYKSVKLFRQENQGQWSDVLGDVISEISKLN